MATVLSYWITVHRPPKASAAHYRNYINDKRRIGFIANKMLDTLDFKSGPRSVEIGIALAAGLHATSNPVQSGDRHGAVFHSGRRPLPDWVGPELWSQGVLSDNNIHMVDIVPKETSLGPRIFRVEKDTDGINWLRIGIGIVPIHHGFSSVYIVSTERF